MSILTIIIVIAVIGFLLWLVNTHVPMNATIKNILNIVVIVALVIWLLKVVGFWGYIGGVKV